MAFKALKNHITSLALPFVSDIANNFVNSGSQKDAGKVAAQLLKKGPFDIPESPSQAVRQNPLSFSPVQYPLDLGSNELGHYIIFESGFLSYQPTDDSMFEASNRGNTPKRQTKITSKTPVKSLSTSAIALYMPAGVKTTYSQSYDADTEGGLAGDVEKGIKSALSAASTGEAVSAALEGVVGGVARQAKTALGEFVSLAGAGDPVRFFAKRAGIAVNPRNEAFYNTPSQRTFSFTFDFWPRNKDEAIAVQKIVEIFKYNSAPGFAAKTQGGVFTIPNYFKISYMYNDDENPYLNKIGACYCTEVDVDYTPDGQFTTFEGGQPVHTKLTVNFLEDRIITKQDIEAGA